MPTKKKTAEIRRNRFLTAMEEIYGDDKINSPLLNLSKEDEDTNLYLSGMTDREFRDVMIRYFLGDNYYIVDPISDTQVTTIAAYEIIKNN